MPEKKTKILISLLVIVNLIIAISLVCMFWIININNIISAEKIMEIRGDVDREETYILLKKDINDNEKILIDLNKYIIQPNSVVEFMSNLEKMALSNGLKYEVKSASLEPIVGSGFNNTELIRIQLNVIGEWKNVEYFLEILETYPLKLNVKSVSLSKFTDYIVNGKKTPQWLESIDLSVVKIKDK